MSYVGAVGARFAAMIVAAFILICAPAAKADAASSFGDERAGAPPFDPPTLAGPSPGQAANGQPQAVASASNSPPVASAGLQATTSGTSASTLGSAAVAWGENFHGQLGTIYKNPHEELPVGVEGLNNITEIVAAESFNLALLTDGTVASWGGDSNGQLGDDAFKANWEREKSHSMVSGLTGVKAVTAANEHAMALLENGTVDTWGSNTFGQMGQGRGGFESETGINSRVPGRVPGLLEEVTAVTSGGPANYVLLKGGEVEAWGGNTDGQLGVPWPENCKKRLQPGCEKFECKTGGGMELCSARPQVVVDGSNKPIKGVRAVYAAQEAAYALLKTGEVLSWGSNFRGQLGQPTFGQGTRFTPPGKVLLSNGAPLTNVVELAAENNHTLARLANGEVVGWGANELGGLGKLGGAECTGVRCVPFATAIPLPKGVQPEAVAAGNQFSLVLAQHKVYAFGGNERGELGNGTTTNSRAPVLVSLPGPVRAISAANAHAVALLEPGAQPPPPAVTVQTKPLAVKIGWSAPTAERLLYHVFERPGPEEFEKEPEPGEGEGPVGGGEGHAPENITLPHIRHEPITTDERVIVGQTTLRATTGGWRGAEPFNFTYQWQRCQTGKCAPITGATNPAYKPNAKDVGSFLQIVVTAKNSIKPKGVPVSSEPTTMVKTEEEGQTSPFEAISLIGARLRSVLINNLFGQPLTTIAYEFKLTSDKPRTVIARPEV